MAAPARKIRIDLAYDGTGFAGWQVQPGRRTVQGTIEAALSRLQGGGDVRVRGAGRTDAGAHAVAQVADASILTRLGDRGLLDGLAAILPADVRPTALGTVSEAFDARRSAVSKTYAYRLDRTPHGDPFRARFALHHPHPMDLDAVRSALARLPGRRDWSGFTAASCEIEDRVRLLSEASVEDEGSATVFRFTANGFLTHMVRIVVGTLLEVARRRFPPERVDEILETGDRRRAGPTVASRGLCLLHVSYPGEAALPGDTMTSFRAEDSTT